MSTGKEESKVGALCEAESGVHHFVSPLSLSMPPPFAGPAYQTAVDVAGEAKDVTGATLGSSTAATMCASDTTLPPPPAFARLFGYDGGSTHDTVRRRRKLHQFHVNTQSVMDLRRVSAAVATAVATAAVTPSATRVGDAVKGHGASSGPSINVTTTSPSASIRRTSTHVHDGTVTSSISTITNMISNSDSSRSLGVRAVDGPVVVQHAGCPSSHALRAVHVARETNLPTHPPLSLQPPPISFISSSSSKQPPLMHGCHSGMGSTVVTVPVPSRSADLDECVCRGGEAGLRGGAGGGSSTGGPSQILDFLYLGSVEDAKDAAFLKANHIRYIINVSEEEYWATDKHIVIFPFRARDTDNFDISTFFAPTRQILDRVRKAYYTHASKQMTHGGVGERTSQVSHPSPHPHTHPYPSSSSSVLDGAAMTSHKSPSTRASHLGGIGHNIINTSSSSVSSAQPVSDGSRRGSAKSEAAAAAAAAVAAPRSLSLSPHTPAHAHAHGGDVPAWAVPPAPRVLVHCQRGRSRSATIVLAYLIYRNGWSVAEALHYVMQRRPCVQPNLGFMQALRELQESMATSLRSQRCSQQSIVLTNIRAETSTETIRRFFERHVGLVRGVVMRRSTGAKGGGAGGGDDAAMTSTLAHGQNSIAGSNSSSSDQDSVHTRKGDTQHRNSSSAAVDHFARGADAAGRRHEEVHVDGCGDARGAGEGVPPSVCVCGGGSSLTTEKATGDAGCDVGVAKEATALRMVFFGCTESVALARTFAARYPTVLQELRPITGKCVKVLMPSKIVAPTSRKDGDPIPSAVKARSSSMAVSMPCATSAIVAVTSRNSVCATHSRAVGVSTPRNKSLSPLHQHNRVCPTAQI